MREEDNAVCVLTWEGVLEPQYRDAFDRWVRAQRYRRACEFVARQRALNAAGLMHQAYFKKHKARLIAEAAELIGCDLVHSIDSNCEVVASNQMNLSRFPNTP